MEASLRNATIIGTGHYVPEKIVPNSWFNEILGEDVDTWLQTNLTIKERRWMSDDQTTSDLCVLAANKALDAAGITPEQVGLLIVSTDTPDYISPSTASVVCHKGGFVNAASFDLNTACAGFVTATETAVRFIKTDDDLKYALVIGAYGMSRFLNVHDKKTATLFADGASAAVLAPTTEDGIGWLGSDLRTRGEFYSYMGIYSGAVAHPSTENHHLEFVTKFPKELNPQMWTDMIRNVASKGGFHVSDIRRAFMTQININQIFETMDNLALPHTTATTVMSTYGYTGSAAIGMALDVSWRRGELRQGDIIVMMGSGGGLTFACNAFRL